MNINEIIKKHIQDNGLEDIVTPAKIVNSVSN